MSITIPQGVTSTGLVITNDELNVYGTAVDTTLNSGGDMYVFSGGKVFGGTVSSGSSVSLSSYTGGNGMGGGPGGGGPGGWH